LQEIDGFGDAFAGAFEEDAVASAFKEVELGSGDSFVYDANL
jgi:hypothetical protein